MFYYLAGKSPPNKTQASIQYIGRWTSNKKTTPRSKGMGSQGGQPRGENLINGTGDYTRHSAVITDPC